MTKRLPDFVILGAQKAGTSFLYTYLSAHPAVMPAAAKELHFFDLHWSRGIDWYRDQFPADMPPAHLTGEATPYYLYHPLAPARLASVLPNARLIVLLRDPVARAISHFNMARRRGQEPLTSMDEAFAAEPARLAGQMEALAAGHLERSLCLQQNSYLDRGRYCPQIRRWFAQMPRDQFLFLQAEALFAQPAKMLAQVCEFLRLPPLPEMAFESVNTGGYEQPPPALKSALAAHFATDQAELLELLGPQYPTAP